MLHDQKYSYSNRPAALFIGMRLGNLKRMHIKTCCNAINTVTLEDVSAKKEETIMNLTGMTFFPGRSLGDGRGSSNHLLRQGCEPSIHVNGS